MCKEYEVVKAFDIVDLYKLNERIRYCKWFQEFLEEEVLYKRDSYVPFETFDQIKCSKVLMKHLDDLENYGFIKEKEKDIELKAGMRLINKNTKREWKVITDQNYGFFLLNKDDQIFNHEHQPWRLSEGCKLSDIRLYYNFEVVDEG